MILAGWFSGGYLVVLRGFSGVFAVFSQSFCGHFVVVLRSFCGHFAVVLRSFCGRFAIDMKMILPVNCISFFDVFYGMLPARGAALTILSNLSPFIFSFKSNR